MKSSEKSKRTAALQEAVAYLDALPEDAVHVPDLPRLQRYLNALTPALGEPRVSPVLVRTVARLYFQAERYQEALMLLKRLKDPGQNCMLALSDFHNGYFASFLDWEDRQAKIWEIFRDTISDPAAAKAGKRAENLARAWEPFFPTGHMSIVPFEEDDDLEGMVLLGNPDGIYSLVPMLYLLDHIPEEISEDWNISMEAPDVSVGEITVQGQEMPLEDIAVRITPSTGFHVGPKMDLALWHPALQAVLPLDHGKAAADILNHIMVLFLPADIAALYVGKISVADRPFGPQEETIPLTALEDWFEDRDLCLDFSLKRALHHRVYAFTREPGMVSRPRGDILRGETCMPELEEIYFLRNGKGVAAFQRYGVGYWFLIVPKKVCGEDFPAFRDALIQAVREEEGDTVCFTGWAEGTRNCYLDFLSLSGISALRTLQIYCKDLPGGEDIRISSFYWNAVPRTLDYAKETKKQAHLGQPMEAGSVPADPPRDQVSEKGRAKLEKAFRETRWEETDADADWDIDGSSPYDESVELLKEAVQYLTLCDMTDTPYNFADLSGTVEEVTPEDDAPDAPEVFCDYLSSVLISLERYRESAKWASRTPPSDERTSRLYTCAVGSDYPYGLNQWEPRRQTYWKQFTAAEPDLLQSLLDGIVSEKLEVFYDQASVVFPTHEAIMFGDRGDKKYTYITGLPGGIVTLPALLYFASHYPGNVGRRWNIAVSWDGAPLKVIPVQDEILSVQDVQVSLRDLAGTVSLALWHPSLAEIAQDSAKEAKKGAARLVNAALPIGARLLYVSDITVAPEEPEDAFPLPALQQQMQARGYRTDIPLDTLLSRRRYAITREGRYNGRPRSDILRGETCMPELERIYNRIYEEGQTVLERHGLAALFLMIPNRLCQGDPAQYRQQLQRYLTLAEGDKVFFTGWAEGTEYCYLDLITMYGRSTLAALNEYALGNPGGRDLRFISFFWNSKPHTWIRTEAQAKLMPERQEDLDRFAREHPYPDFPVPDAAAVSAFEASFQPLFTPEDLCAPKPAEAPPPAPQKPAVGKKKLSKAQRKAQNSQNNQNNKNGKNGKKKR